MKTTRRFYDNVTSVLRAWWDLRSATRMGRRIRIWGRIVVRNEGELFIGDRVRMISTVTPTELNTGPEGRLEIGERTFINYGTSIGATKSIRIGPRCNIGTYVIMMDNDFHRLEPERRHEMPESQPIVLEENVWLGARVIVLGGVTIGAGSVIGAGSIVTRNIPPRSLAIGAPARVIRQI